MPPRKIYHAQGSITTTPQGTYLADTTQNTIRHRKRFKNLNNAKLWLEQMQEQPLTHAQYDDIRVAIKHLPPTITLTDCVKYYNTAHPAKPPIQISQAIANYMADNQDLRPKTLANYTYNLKRLQRRFLPTATINQITPTIIQDLLSTMPPASYNSFLRTLSAFSTYLIRTKDLTKNLATDHPKKKISEPQKQTLTLTQVHQLLDYVTQHTPTATYYFTIGLFAGLRPEEIHRLTPQDIRDEYILLSAQQTKTSQSRTVPIQPNLKSWLKSYPLNPAYPITHQLLKQIRKALPFAWSQDILRHSYASYRYEQTRNASETAFEMGHRGVDIFFRHYRGLIPPNEGTEYFNIYPNPS